MSGKLIINAQTVTSRSKNGFSPSLTIQGKAEEISKLQPLLEIQMPAVSVYSVQPTCLVIVANRHCDNANQAKKIQVTLKKRIYTLFKQFS